MFVESSAPTDTAALAEAQAAAEEIIAGFGRDPRRMRFVPEAAELRRCSRVTMRVEYPVPLLTIPAIGRFGHGFTAVGRHSEIVDPFRAGLADRSTCPAAAPAMSGRRDDGSALVLVPAGILVLLVLASIALDSSLVLLAQRELAARAAATAQDAASLALADDTLYRDGQITLDAARAEAYTAIAFAPEVRPATFTSWSAAVRAEGRQVTVEATAEVQLRFRPAWPGSASTTTVHARSVARAEGG